MPSSGGESVETLFINTGCHSGKSAEKLHQHVVTVLMTLMGRHLSQIDLAKTFST